MARSFSLFLEWKTCYDRIHHDRLLHALRRFGLPEHYLKVIEAIYSTLTFFVRDSWGKSSTKVQEEGLKQGDPLSCSFLVILMTVIMIDARERYDAECADKNMELSTQRDIFFLVLMTSTTQMVPISLK